MDIARAEELEKAELWRDAIDAWVELAREKNDTEFLLRAAYVAVDAEFDAEAETLLLDIIRDRTDLPDAYFQIGLLCWKQSRFEEAELFLIQGLELEERQPILTILGGIYHVLGDQDSARSILNRSLVLKADDDEVYYALGQIEIVDHPSVAIEHFEHSIAIDPLVAPAWRQLGEAQWRDGRLDEAEKSLRHALEMDSADAWTHNYLGHVLSFRHEWDAAKPAFAAATELDPTVGMFWRNLADAYSMLGSLVQAERYYLKSLSLEIDSAHANARYGVFLKSTRQFDRARRYLRRALAIDSSHRGAKTALAELDNPDGVKS